MLDPPLAESTKEQKAQVSDVVVRTTDLLGKPLQKTPLINYNKWWAHMRVPFRNNTSPPQTSLNLYNKFRTAKNLEPPTESRYTLYSPQRRSFVQY